MLHEKSVANNIRYFTCFRHVQLPFLPLKISAKAASNDKVYVGVTFGGTYCR